MKGCIVVHGLSGSPRNVESLKEYLTASGYSVVTPCLAGHGGAIEDLNRSTWQDWYNTVQVAYAELRRSVEKVYYVGLSLGALLGIKLAQDEGFGVRALALLSTPLSIKNSEKIAIPVLRYTPLRFMIESIEKKFDSSVTDPDGRLLYKNTSLSRQSIPAAFQFSDLQKDIRKKLKGVANPILMVHSKLDTTSPLKNVEILKNSVSSDIIETLVLEKSRHVITMDLEKNLVADRIIEFFKKID